MAGSVAFVCAMPMELAPLQRRLSLEKTPCRIVDLYPGRSPAGPWWRRHGHGRASSPRRRSRRLLGAVDVERVVVVGITGALASRRTRSARSSARGGRRRGQRRRAPAGSARRGPSRAARCGRPTSSSPIRRPSRGLQADGVVALDMETAAIAEACDRPRHPVVGVPGGERPGERRESRRRGFRADQPGRLVPPGGDRRLLPQAPGSRAGDGPMSKDARLAAERAAAAAVAAVGQLAADRGDAAGHVDASSRRGLGRGRCTSIPAPVEAASRNGAVPSAGRYVGLPSAGSRSVTRAGGVAVRRVRPVPAIVSWGFALPRRRPTDG